MADAIFLVFVKGEPLHEKTSGPTQTGLYSHRRWLESSNLGNMDLDSRGIVICIHVAKTNKGTDTAQLICTFGFIYAKSRFSHDVAQINAVHFTFHINSNVSMRYQVPS